MTSSKMTNKRTKRSRVQLAPRSTTSRPDVTTETSIIVKDEFDFEANEQELLTQKVSLAQRVTVRNTSKELIITDDFEFKDEVNLTSYGTKKRRVIVVSAEKDTKKKRVHVHRNQRRNLTRGECEVSAKEKA